MYICEAILITIIVILGFYVAIIDIKNNVIPNKVLIVSGIIGSLVNVIYYIMFAHTFLKLYISNLLVMTVFSLLMYALHFWAAGDSKLLICVIWLFPSRFYDNKEILYFPGMMLVLLIFFIAYIYVLIDTCIQWRTKKKFYKRKAVYKKQLIQIFLSILSGFIYLRGLSSICQYLLGNIYVSNRILFAFINIFAVLIIHKYSFFTKWYILLFMFIIDTILLKKVGMNSFSVKPYIILILAIVFRYFVSGYNYEEIKTEKVCEGMVMSYQTIMEFSVSKIKGLPCDTNEDMSVRINSEEAEAIKRWGKSKKGKEYITIVRKIPFAIFIIMGAIIYFLIRVLR